MRLPFLNTPVGAGGGSFVRSCHMLSRWGRAVPRGCFFPNGLRRLDGFPSLFEFVGRVLGQLFPRPVHGLSGSFHGDVHHLIGSLVTRGVGGVLFLLVERRVPDGTSRLIPGLQPQIFHGGPRNRRLGFHSTGFHTGFFQLDLLQ